MALASINKVQIMGNLGQDPEIRQIPNGPEVANLRIATSERWKDKNTGELKERTEWHTVVLYGRLAEIAREFLKKGSHVYIEGSNKTEKWDDKQGTTHYTTKIVGRDLKMLGGTGGSAQSAPTGDTPAPANDSFNAGSSDFDEIPF